MHTTEMQIVNSGILGVATAGYMTTSFIVLLDMSGVELYKDALALRLIFGGLASLIGPVTVGWLLDITGDTTLSFYFMGISCMVCAVILCGLLYRLTRIKDVQTTALVDSEPQMDGESEINDPTSVNDTCEKLSIADDLIITHI
ncbi:PREDICTED: monocarboxylate transporter 14-like [Priapulus caudatus]|uniref:Monocarboxylate transporter 14-like n=1 Tax=Priapulus caudatus TaxID=37621 RepID=A0ABM1E3T7_PRICU|nr:PREDICTED: monocarboxylate transporter 14-like [Priapulus caudatus]